MEVSEINAAKFQEMIRVAAHRLAKNAEFVNSLNVFPVPDGDTGTNMNLTFATGAKAVLEADDQHVGQLAKKLGKGLLMGARGNSGVISSQLFRGFAKSVEAKETLNAQDLADAFAGGVETAYKAVMKPVEGTILTVAREGAKAGLKAAQQSTDTVVVMSAVVKAAKRALAKTPDLLPVLKEVGVVDSGGQGLCFIYEGFREGLAGEASDDDFVPDEAEMNEMVNATHHQGAQTKLNPDDIVYGYCTEMMVELGVGDGPKKPFDYEPFRNYLNELGDSTLVVADDEVVKVHVHTEHPGTIFKYGQQFGALAKIKVDNMRLQHESIIEREDAIAAEQKPQPLAESGVVAIAAGAGLGELFESLGVAYVLNGGQTMNPSTNDILEAIKAAHAKKVLVLPNNSNIFMAAQEAAKASDVDVAIVKTKTINQGLTAMLGYNPEASLDDNQNMMTGELANVVSGSVTRAIRDTTIDGLAIHTDDWMGIIDGAIKITNVDRVQATVDMIKAMLDEDSEIITLIVGADGTTAEAEQIQTAVEALDDDLEVEIHQGDQPVYPYLVSVE
ncbi:DAK2 domain-containing protein [Lacticaseibacillus manihotivorans]|uniref:Dihydroxyacetone kinase(DAK2)-like enzyme n=2 Tax=Lacticaseibacillus manihotivorans TaxID=88233 RepID=A0A0R1RHP7_9LACO|nr:DAK2 domain-containing protein [Lacticaseibacillus manihotivorans]KRL53187.1 dihydroxyacetone kinase(DAK2)-like enzyme [Lacticaseibacillus manihotivorans DSM 13343 = JCM 12514]QFQ91221.1 DAK2 domain-containing protein [Lacticaseibacillus manihotivorans]